MLQGMRRSFTLRSGMAVGLSVVLLSFVLLTWLPGPSPVDGTGWPVPSIVLAFLLLGTALYPAMKDEPSAQRGAPPPKWSAFGYLPNRVKAVPGLLIALSVAMIIITAAGGLGNFQSPTVEGGRYFSYDLSTSPRVKVELSRSQYEAVTEGQQRIMLSIASLMSALAGGVFLGISERRRQDAVSR
ncbi:hypothetical protein ACIBJF_46425 [Streptomyces sp. NPDC050743]|uniref:hypothetical protein n=1 Tax=Streptomyces sp. NPDC050743 TaxID=3365634 RepID=UPI0037B24D68